MKTIPNFLMVIFLLNSCAQGLHEQIVPVTLQLKNIEKVLVLDAKIEKDSNAWVQISYSNDIDNPFQAEPVYGTTGKITLSSNKGESELLVYSGNKGIYTGSKIKGNIGTTYKLSVLIEGKEYSAETTMMPLAKFNSIEINPSIKNVTKGDSYNIYEEIWYISNDNNVRNLYMFEWWVNGVHLNKYDWAIDDDRIPNGSKGIRVFNPTINPELNQRVEFRMAEIDFKTYNYFNMYEKIVRGIVSASDQTPYNPVSSFGAGTVGNFRAVSFTQSVVLMPPQLYLSTKSNAVDIYFERNPLYVKYNLYWSKTPDVSTKSNVMLDIPFTKVVDKNIIYGNFLHTGLTSGNTLYYKIEAEDVQGNKSILSPEATI
jgi:hypothetical protein